LGGVLVDEGGLFCRNTCISLICRLLEDAAAGKIDEQITGKE